MTLMGTLTPIHGSAPAHSSGMVQSHPEASPESNSASLNSLAEASAQIIDVLQRLRQQHGVETLLVITRGSVRQQRFVRVDASRKTSCFLRNVVRIDARHLAEKLEGYVVSGAADHGGIPTSTVKMKQKEQIKVARDFILNALIDLLRQQNVPEDQIPKSMNYKSYENKIVKQCGAVLVGYPGDKGIVNPGELDAAMLKELLCRLNDGRCHWERPAKAETDERTRKSSITPRTPNPSNSTPSSSSEQHQSNMSGSPLQTNSMSGYQASDGNGDDVTAITVHEALPRPSPPPWGNPVSPASEANSDNDDLETMVSDNDDPMTEKLVIFDQAQPLTPSTTLNDIQRSPPLLPQAALAPPPPPCLSSYPNMADPVVARAMQAIMSNYRAYADAFLSLCALSNRSSVPSHHLPFPANPVLDSPRPETSPSSAISQHTDFMPMTLSPEHSSSIEYHQNLFANLTPEISPLTWSPSSSTPANSVQDWAMPSQLIQDHQQAEYHHDNRVSSSQFSSLSPSNHEPSASMWERHHGTTFGSY